MIDVRTEDLFPLAELPERWPLLPGGRRLHRSVGYRYAKQGVGPSRVRLEVVRMGGRLFTSAEAVARFVERLTEADEDRPEPRPSRAERSARRRVAAQLLNEAGICSDLGPC